MHTQLETVADEFDRCARILQPGDDDTLYHAALLAMLPPRFDVAADIGCGRGSFSQRLARRARVVIGIDYSTEMLRLAKSTMTKRIRGNAAQLPLRPSTCDVVVSLKTLHHVDAAQMIAAMTAALCPGGTLLIHDVLASESKLHDDAAAIVATARRILFTGRVLERKELRQFWSHHAGHDD